MTTGASDGPPLPDKVVSIHESLAQARIPHAIGGALALAYYAEPRATIDIDLNIFIPVERWREVIEILSPLGVDAEKLEEAAILRDGQCRLWWGSNPVDLFFAYDEIHDAMREETRRVPFADTRIPILSPEHLTICKLVFDRPKDWLDVEQILVATEELDVAAIDRWLVRMVGVDDSRVERFAELKERLAVSE
jgi:hypothetical protein